MKVQFQSYLRKVLHWYDALSSRERAIVIGVLGVAVVALVYQGISSMNVYVASTDRKVATRKSQLDDVHRSLKRYVSLKNRQDNLQKSFAQSEMTFEQVTAKLDRIVRDSIGSDNYELKKARTPTPFGFEYEKQEFTLNIRSLAIDQLVKLLYQLEQGESPLFLSKVDIVRSSASSTIPSALSGGPGTTSSGDYGAVLEIYSIAKSQVEETSTDEGKDV